VLTLLLNILFAAMIGFAALLGMVAIAGVIVFGACKLWEGLQEFRPPQQPFRFKSPAEVMAERIAAEPIHEAPPPTPATPDETVFVLLAINPLSNTEYLAGATRRRVLFTSNKRRAKVFPLNEQAIIRAWMGYLSKSGHEDVYVVHAHQPSRNRQYSGERPTEIVLMKGVGA
jgi:hypothetical protein